MDIRVTLTWFTHNLSARHICLHEYESVEPSPTLFVSLLDASFMLALVLFSLKRHGKGLFEELL